MPSSLLTFVTSKESFNPFILSYFELHYSMIAIASYFTTLQYSISILRRSSHENLLTG